MALEIFKSKETEIRLKDKFELEGYNWEEVKKNLERIDKLKDIDKHLHQLDKNSGDYIENYYSYLKGLIDNKDNKKHFSIEETIKKKKESAKKWALKKIKNIPLFGGILETAFSWSEDSKPNENDNGFDKIIKNIKASIGGFILGLFGGNFYKKYKERIDILDNELKENKDGDNKDSSKNGEEKKVWKEK